jgi:RNA polymerase sigma-70 factor (ECF subfamily)
MTEQERHILFSELIARYQGPLYSYIFAAVKNRNDAEDIFQSVCLVLWRKFDSFQPNTNFLSWAYQTAKLILYSSLRQKRKWNCASEELLNALADTASNVHVNEDSIYLAAFRRCRDKLASPDEELLRFRYIDDLDIREIANRLQRLPPNVCRSLNRVRRWLLDCVRMELARQEHPPEGCHG